MEIMMEIVCILKWIMLGLLVIGILLVCYILLGYSPKRRLETQEGGIYYFGIGKRILWSVKVDKRKDKTEGKLPWYLSIIPCPPGIKNIFPPLNWTDIIPKERLSEKLPGTGEDRFKNPRPADAEGKTFFVERDELVPFYFIWEPVDYSIPFKSKDGFDGFLNLTIVYEIEGNGMGPIGRPDFKKIGQIEVSSKIGPWTAGICIDDLRKIDVDDLKKGIRFMEDDEEEEKNPKYITLMQFLNKKMEPFECDTHTIALAIEYGQNTKEYFRRKNDNQDLLQEAENQKALEAVKVEERNTKLNDAKNDAQVAEVEFNGYLEPVKNFMTAIYEGEEKVKKARPNVFIEANTETPTIGVTAFKEVMGMVKNATGRDIFAERKLEEADNG
jgi:hypothetical protein